jgi:hypothetical protein
MHTKIVTNRCEPFINFVILSEAKDLCILLAAPDNPYPLRKHRASSAPRPVLYIRERVGHAVRRLGKGTTPPMHYRGSSKGRAFC